MRVLAEGYSRSKVDAHLDGLASGDAEIVPLQVGPLDSRLLSLRYVQRQNASDDQRRYRHDSHGLHLNTAHVEFLWFEDFTELRGPSQGSAGPCGRPGPDRDGGDYTAGGRHSFPLLKRVGVVRR